MKRAATLIVRNCMLTTHEFTDRVCGEQERPVSALVRMPISGIYTMQGVGGVLVGRVGKGTGSAAYQSAQPAPSCACQSLKSTRSRVVVDMLVGRVELGIVKLGE